ncbi:hypothetical protein RIR_jg11539.t1 [Rhizophagus irregularis DAOM 181602=DAOM 197198]|nr:hypothetical protein RIR_jg11539.t1 [Rhizophagus irregularis DAOM 181602=DAOM 197198]
MNRSDECGCSAIVIHLESTRFCRGKLEALDWFLRRFLRRFLNDCYKLILYFTHSDQCPVLGVSLNEDNLDL